MSVRIYKDQLASRHILQLLKLLSQLSEAHQYEGFYQEALLVSPGKQTPIEMAEVAISHQKEKCATLTHYLIAPSIVTLIVYG
jgi:hypothetical protein